MEPQRQHVAVVLAAGGSSRLGMAKQLLLRDSETLIHRTVRLVAATRPARIIVVLGANAERLATELADIPHTPVVNAGWHTGLAGSLRAAALHVPKNHAVLIVACDQPALEEHHLRLLLAGADAVPARSAATDIDGVLGIPAVVPGEWFADLDAQGDRGFRDRLRSLPVDAVFRLQAQELARDIDTPAELRDAVQAGLLDTHCD